METIINDIKDGLQNIFPSINGMEINSETKLKELSDWDSRASLYLMMFLQHKYNANMPRYFIHKDLKIGDIASHVIKC